LPQIKEHVGASMFPSLGPRLFPVFHRCVNPLKDIKYFSSKPLQLMMIIFCLYTWEQHTPFDPEEREVVTRKENTDGAHL
jgi:hypothetical protein